MKDIIIIGAGPAGNIVAEKTAEAGLDVLVLDWRQIIGDKLCTGIIGKECLDKFPPREEDIYHEVKSATLISPNNKTYRITRSNTQAAILNRVSYNRLPLLSPVNILPVLFDPCAPGARPNIKIDESISPNDGTGFPQ